MTLTTEMLPHAERWRLGLRVGPERLDVLLYSAVGEGSPKIYELPFDSEADNRLKALEAVVYDNPLLLSDFDRVSCIIETRQAIVLPSGAGGDAEVAEKIFNATFADFSGETFLSETGVPEVEIMAGDAEGLTGFLRRTFFNVKIMSHLSPLCRYFLSAASRGNGRRIYGNLREGYTDIVATEGRRLLIANSFSTPTAADAGYYMLAVRQATGHDEDAELLLAGRRELRQQLMGQMRQAGQAVMPVIFPSVMFEAGQDAMNAPFDLIVLPLCE